MESTFVYDGPVLARWKGGITMDRTRCLLYAEFRNPFQPFHLPPTESPQQPHRAGDEPASGRIERGGCGGYNGAAAREKRECTFKPSMGSGGLTAERETAATRRLPMAPGISEMASRLQDLRDSL